MTRVRRVRRAVAIALGLGALMGCTVPSAGRTGVSVSESGRPIAVFVLCHDHIDGATLSIDGEGTEEPRSIAHWEPDEPVTGFAAWALDALDGAEQHGSPRRPKRNKSVTYHVHGWTNDDSWATTGVDFTRAQLAELKPGQIRYWTGDREGTDKYGHRTGTLEQFRTAACG